MTDYSTWPDARINYHIACMTGCKLEVTPEYGSLPWLRLVDKNDSHIKDTDVTWGSMETRRQFWSWGLWANDANMALKLLTDITVIECHPTTKPPLTWYMQFVYYPAREVVGFETHVFAKSFPRALCECWLMWQDALNPFRQSADQPLPRTPRRHRAG